MSTLPDFMFAGTGVPMLAPAEETGPREEAFAGEFIAANDDAPLPPPPPFVPGVFDDMPAEQYHATEAMSASGAHQILRSQKHYKLMRDQRGKQTAAMRFGQALHVGVLEPQRYAEAVVTAPDVNKRTKAGRAELAEFMAANRHRIVISPAERVRALRCAEEVRAHPSAAKLLAGAQTEKSLFWIDGKFGVPCKARLDIWNFSIVADLKSTTDASREGFARAIATYGYGIQAANYINGCEHILNQSPQAFVFIAVESDPPHAVGVYAIDTADILFGRARMDVALERYARALDSGRWQGYSDLIESIITPPWARRMNV